MITLRPNYLHEVFIIFMDAAPGRNSGKKTVDEFVCPNFKLKFLKQKEPCIGGLIVSAKKR